MCQGLGPKKHDEISEIDRTPLQATAGGQLERGAASVHEVAATFHVLLYPDQHPARLARPDIASQVRLGQKCISKGIWRQGISSFYVPLLVQL